MTNNRASGILLHPTSLPGPDGIGDLGPEAYRWVDFLAATGTQFWQILPLGPTGYGDSPYQCFSAFAGNPYLVSPSILLEQGLIDSGFLRERPEFDLDKVDYGPVIDWKVAILEAAYVGFLKNKADKLAGEFAQFKDQEAYWLDDFALFMALKASLGGRSWVEWPADIRKRDPKVLDTKREALSAEIEKNKFFQFLFDSQWSRLKKYCEAKGIRVIGDMPFVIALDSADVWAHPDLFLLDDELQPTMVAGVPPDYFSATGQLWGNPLYRWEVHLEEEFGWWNRRLNKIMQMVDLVRLDHFRGFAAAWHVPYGEKTAINGEWIASPGDAILESFSKTYPVLPIIAEDLGVITPDVKALRDNYQLAGMKILQFGFTGDPEDDFLPHHYPEHCFAYTGSHDNNTALGWYQAATAAEKRFCERYLHAEETEISWAMIRAIWQSAAENVVAPMQDLLALDESARMNLPGSESGNWGWRMRPDALTKDLATRLYELNLLYSRLPAAQKEKITRELAAQLGDTVKPH